MGSEPEVLALKAVVCYEPSGRFGALAVPLALAAGIPAAAAVGWLYQWLVDVVGWIYLNFLATVFFGGIVGAAVAWGLKAGRCRSVALAAAMGVVCGAAGEAATFEWSYVRHAAALEEDARSRGATEQDVATLRAEFGMSEFVRERVEEGWRVIGIAKGEGMRLSGAFVWLVWALETLLVAGFATAVAMLPARAPFCEVCDAYEPKEDLGRVVSADADALETAVRTGDLSGVLPVARAVGSGVTAAYTLRACPSCGEGGHVTVETSWVVEGKKGKRGKKARDEVKKKEVLTHAVLTSAQRDRLRAAFAPRR